MNTRLQWVRPHKSNRLNIFPLISMPVRIDEKPRESPAHLVTLLSAPAMELVESCCRACIVELQEWWHHTCRETGQKSQREGEGSERVTVINQLLFREHRSTSAGAFKHHSPSKPKPTCRSRESMKQEWQKEREAKNKWKQIQKRQRLVRFTSLKNTLHYYYYIIITLQQKITTLQFSVSAQSRIY